MYSTFEKLTALVTLYNIADGRPYAATDKDFAAADEMLTELRAQLEHEREEAKGDRTSPEETG